MLFQTLPSNVFFWDVVGGEIISFATFFSNIYTHNCWFFFNVTGPCCSLVPYDDWKEIEEAAKQRGLSVDEFKSKVLPEAIYTVVFVFLQLKEAISYVFI